MTRKLVCYDCGIACDLTQMRDERLVALRKLGAHKPTMPVEPRRLPVFNGDHVARGAPRRRSAFAQAKGARWRIRFGKLGRGAFISHLDTMRLLIRVFRRARVEMIYSKGFHPKPQLDVRAGARPRRGGAGRVVRRAHRLRRRRAETLLRAAARGGARGAASSTASPSSAPTSRRSRKPAGDAPTSRRGCRRRRRRCAPRVSWSRAVQKRGDQVDRRGAPSRRRAARRRRRGGATLRAALEWPAGGVILGFRLRIEPNGGAKPSEVIAALTGATPPEGTRYARTALWAQRDGGLVDPMALDSLRAAPVAAPPASEGTVVAGDPDGDTVTGTDGVLPVAAAAADSRN